MYENSQQAIADEAKRSTALQAGAIASDPRHRIEQLSDRLRSGDAFVSANWNHSSPEVCSAVRGIAAQYGVDTRSAIAHATSALSAIERVRDEARASGRHGAQHPGTQDAPSPPCPVQ